jgi:histidyl-tRNA synthetase
MDEEGLRYAFQCLSTLRKAGIAADMYPESAKLKKQMNYANNRKVPYTVLIGEAERSSGQLSLKDMATGEQRGMRLEEVVKALS